MWKKLGVQRKAKKKIKLALIVLGLVIAVIILGQIANFAKILVSPWGLLTPVKKYNWNPKFNLNLVVHTNSTSVLSYNPQEGKIIIINIPDQTFMEVPGGFGKWQLGAVYGLGKNELLKKTMMNYLGLPIDGFLDFTPPFKNIKEILGILRGNPISSLQLLPNLKSDLTFWQLIRLKFGLASVRFDKIIELNLDQLDVLEKSALLDGSIIFNTDLVKLDTYLTVLKDSVIAKENKSIAIFNATTQPQLANKWARLVTNLGANVIITANAGKTLQKTEVSGQKSATLERFKQIFDINDKISQSNEGETSRAEINLLVGEDYAN
ncbi:LCP family protein [Candidatus Daviesbacteria bacterium]|nr:LCP family protein [Candidatus Daviesbacteria bacterium]